MRCQRDAAIRNVLDEHSFRCLKADQVTFFLVHHNQISKFYLKSCGESGDAPDEQAIDGPGQRPGPIFGNPGRSPDCTPELRQRN